MKTKHNTNITTATTEGSNPEVLTDKMYHYSTYDKYSFIVAYVGTDGCLEIEEPSLLREVKKGTRIGASLQEVCDDLRQEYYQDHRDNTEKDGGYGSHGFQFEYIYKGCERVKRRTMTNEKVR
jgi:hypothetical protein